MSTESKFLTPVYQPILVTPILTMEQQIIAGQYRLAWESGITAFNVLDQDCKAEVAELFKKINEQLTAISSESTKDLLFRSSDIENKQTRFLKNATLEFLAAVSLTLYKHGYMVQESNRPPTREQGMQNFEMTVGKAIFSRP